MLSFDVFGLSETKHSFNPKVAQVRGVEIAWACAASSKTLVSDRNALDLTLTLGHSYSIIVHTTWPGHGPRDVEV